MIMKLKDYFTAGNIICGVISTFLVIEAQHHPDTALTWLNWAGYFILFGWVFDVLDGKVARWTNCFNKFGAEFDNIADLVNYSIVPAFLIYGYYTYYDPTLKGKIIAGVLAMFPPLFGSIRIARFNIKRIEYPGIWFGLPRPTSAFLIVCLFGLKIFQEAPEIGYFFIPFFSILNLLLFPMLGHHGTSVPKSWKFFLIYIVTIPIVISFGLHLFTSFKIFFEVTFFWMLMYIIAFPILTTDEKKEDIKAFLKQWRSEEEQGL